VPKTKLARFSKAFRAAEFVSMAQPPQDPIEFFQNLWAKAGPGFPAAVPGMNADDIDRRIAELKAVQGWLQTNLGVLQASIQALEMQKAGVQGMQGLAPDAKNLADAWLQAVREYGKGVDTKDGEGTGTK
jgi:hypothetical protein